MSFVEKQSSFLTQVSSSATGMRTTEASSGLPIENPRQYQLELFQKAKEGNVIAVLETGAGKVFFIINLTRRRQDRPTRVRSSSRRRRRLCPNVGSGRRRLPPKIQ